MSDPTAPPAANIRIAGRRVELAPHHCFGCGTLNAAGLQLVLHVDGATCWTELELPRRFEGWEGIAHGGIVSTILDEVMAWSLVEHDSWGLTARLNVAFRRPVPIGRRIRAEGWVVEAGRRLLRTVGRVVDPGSDEVLATAEAAYVPAPEARKRELRERYRFRLVAEDEAPRWTGARNDVPEAVAGGRPVPPPSRRRREESLIDG
jgi:uncharacterized protein (TIGR00369 family)